MSPNTIRNLGDGNKRTKQKNKWLGFGNFLTWCRVGNGYCFSWCETVALPGCLRTHCYFKSFNFLK
jgi:hypothetical protein